MLASNTPARDRRPQRTSRAHRLGGFAIIVLGMAFGSVRPGAAQDREEVIVDPELAGPGAKPAAPANDEEVIADPELGDAPTKKQDYGWGDVYEDAPKPAKGAPLAAPEPEEEYDPMANTGIAKLELLGQVAADLRHEGELEDAYETRLRFGGEIELRRSRNVRIMLGSRLDFLWALPSQKDNIVIARDERALDEDRFEVDVFATAAYVDTTLADGVHLRIGQQVVSLGRMDLYAPTDMLAVYDTRPQPRLDLGANKLAQPALRLDWDMSSWATLQAVYVPWFSPNLSRPNRDQYVGAVLTGRGASQLPSVGTNLIDPSYQTKASEANLRFVGPAPDFKTPQAEVRANFRGSSLEFAISGGTALEKTPSIYSTPRVSQYLINPEDDRVQTPLGSALLSEQAVIDVEYHRYYLLGIDGSFDIAPVSIGFEFAYSPSRHIYAATKDGSMIPQPNVSQQIYDPIPPSMDGENFTPSNVTDPSIRKGVPMVQGALHVEWLKGETFALIAEGFWINALELPYDKTRDWWGFREGTGAFMGGMVGMTYILNDGQVRFDLTAITLVGPSLIAVPHVEVRARDGLYFDLGAQIFEGPPPGLNGAQNLNVGGLLSGYDQVFVGMRWLP